MKRKLAFFLLVLMLCQLLLPVSASAEGEPYALSLVVNGERRSVRAYDDAYRGNLYISLTDLSAVLSGTEKQFRFERIISSADGEYFSITTGQPSVLASGADYAPGYSDPIVLNPYRNRLWLDGQERKYYTHNTQNGDLFMSLADVQLMLDFTMERAENGGWILKLDTPFCPNPEQLRSEGYFESISVVYLADASTDTVLFQQNGNLTVPVASISKLLSYLILKEAVDAGEIRETDTVRISDRAEALANSADGMVKLQAGTEVPFSELMTAMLVASSNESALALAEHLCGSEAAFVSRMMARAGELGLSSARMLNAHGLPTFSGGSVPVKRQNCMSAYDLYRLTKLVLEKYPEITDITSQTLAHMPSLNDYRTANSNPLVFNLEGVNGLKTGHTNRAGYCVVVTLPVSAADGTHNLILVLLGAESAIIRGQAAEILLRYARAQYSGATQY